MAINISTLFADIIDTPEQRQEKLLQQGQMQGRLLASGLTGRARALAPLAQMAGQLGVQRNEDIRRAVQPMLGIDPRTTGEKLQEKLQGIKLDTPQGLTQAAQMLQTTDPIRAASLRQAATELLAKQKIQTDKEAKILKEAKAEREFRNTVATRARLSPRFEADESAIRDGSIPMAQVENIYSELTKKIDAQKLDPIQIIREDGTQQTALYDGLGNFFDPSLPNSKLTINDNDLILKSSVVAQPEDFSKNPEYKKLRDTQIGVYSFTSQANNIISALESNSDANTAVASVASTFNNLATEANSALRFTGNQKDDFFKKFNLGQESAEMKSMLLAVTYNAAKIVADQQGRAVSNQDVENFMTIVGANVSDPQVIKANLERLKSQIHNDFRYRHRMVTGEEFTGEFEPVPQGPPNFAR